MSKWCVGVDLGGTYIKFGLLDEQRQPTKTFQLRTPSGSEGVVRQIVTGVRRALEQHQIAPADVVGVGVGTPGPMDFDKGVILAMPNIPGMANLPLRDLVSSALGIPTVLENDANAAAFGEYLCGSDRSADMVLLTLGTGVGSGIVVRGKIVRGWHKLGAELGHMIVEPNGEPCGCGQQGCLERYCSATYLAQHARKLIEGGRESSLSTVLKEKGEIDAKDIGDARKAGDALAAELWQRWAFYMAVACVNICRILDPDEILLGGGMAKAGESLLKPLRVEFERLHWKIVPPRTRIGLARLGNDAGVIGAAGAAWQELAKG